MAQRHSHRRLSAGRYALLCALSMTAALAVQALAPSAAHAQSAAAQSFDLPAGNWYITQTSGEFAQIWIACQADSIWIPLTAVGG